MADLQRAREANGLERPGVPPQAAGHLRAAVAAGVRPRIGRGPSETRRPGRARIDRGVALRSLAISCAVAVFVLGGFYLLHSLGLGRTEEAAHDAQPAPGVAAGLVPTTATAAPAAEEIAAAAVPAQAAPAPLAATPATAAPAQAPAPPAPTGPTAADFARPAFLEPLEADKADADATDDPPPEAVAPASAARPGAEPSGAEQAEARGENGRINTAINLRSAPQRGASVLATLEAGTKVTVYSCKSWCEVAANGKRGYVYRRAVDQ